MLRTTDALLFCAALSIAAFAGAQDPVKVVKITDSIYMAPMTSNVYLVMTSEGNVVIDTAPQRDAQEAKELLTSVSSAPVRYIILTHGHIDHIGGIGLWYIWRSRAWSGTKKVFAINSPGHLQKPNPEE